MTARLRRALVALDSRRKQVDAILREDYRLGGHVTYRRPDYPLRLRGIVVDHGEGRLKVCNCETGREYWIAAARIVEAL